MLPVFQDLSRADYVRKPAGTVVIDGVEVASTRQCVHCQQHFISVRGSGALRGFCRNCMGDTCGAPKCDRCLPAEKKLDLYESGKLSVLR